MRRWHSPPNSAAVPKSRHTALACPMCSSRLGSGGKRRDDIGCACPCARSSNDVTDEVRRSVRGVWSSWWFAIRTAWPSAKSNRPGTASGPAHTACHRCPRRRSCPSRPRGWVGSTAFAEAGRRFHRADARVNGRRGESAVASRRAPRRAARARPLLRSVLPPLRIVLRLLHEQVLQSAAAVNTCVRDWSSARAQEVISSSPCAQGWPARYARTRRANSGAGSSQCTAMIWVSLPRVHLRRPALTARA